MKRSPAEWAVRIVLTVLAAVLGYFSVTFSLAQVVVKTDPALAYRLAPYDGRITARLAASLATPDASPADRARADELAKKALRQDPTAVIAASVLGLNADVRGDKAAARRYFGYAQKLSRRDSISQLWAIEDAVARGDIPAALRHYDIVLRVTPEAADMLYPVLTAASTDPAIRPELIKTLAGKPAWASNFIGHVAAGSDDPRASAALFVGLRRAGVDVPQAAQSTLVNALIAGGHVEQAWAYYASVRSGADRRRSRDPRFAAQLEARSQFDWVPVDDGSVSTSIQRGEGGGVFDFAAPASVSGALLQQAQLLPPGRYRLSGHSAGIEQQAGALPYWSLACRADGRELGRVVVPNSNTAGGRFAGEFIVPGGCPAQVLTLVARPSDAVGGLAGQIDRVVLEPAS